MIITQLLFRPDYADVLFAGTAFSQDATTFGQLAFAPTTQAVVQPYPRVRAKSIDWNAVCAMAGRPAVQLYPVYQFGGGTVRRIFTQPT